MTVAYNEMRSIMALAPVVPVITIHDPAHAVPLARALVRGGLRALEVTLRTKAALAAIQAMATEVPEAVVGAGTVISRKQIDQVARAGGQFCVSPGATPMLLNAARDAGMKLLPGVATASELMAMLERDLTYLKFFPAQAAGGVPMLKSLGGPLPQAVFCPTGGIKPGNAAEFLALPNVLCVGGTWICPQEALERGDWAHIENLARQAATMV